MYNYLRLVRLFFKDTYGLKSKKHIAVTVFLASVYLTFLFIALFTIYTMHKAVAEAGKISEFITFYYFIAFMITVVFGTVTSISYLYMSKDSEFFLALPIKPNTVFLAKLTTIYLGEMALCAAFLVPCLIFSGALFNTSVIFYLLIIPAVLAAPLFAMIFIAIISVPLISLISFFKNRGAAGSIFVMLLFIIIFGTYMAIYMSAVSTMGNESASYAPTISLATTVSKIFYPLLILSRLSLGQSVFGLGGAAAAAAGGGAFVASIAAIIFVVYLLSRVVYNKTLSRMLVNKGGTVKIKGKDKQSSALKTLIKKEWREVVRMPSIAMQVLSGAVMCPLILFVTTLTMGKAVNPETVNPQEIDLFTQNFHYFNYLLGYMMLLMIGIGTNTGAAFCISKEGRNISLVKCLPVDFSTQANAKKYLFLIISIVSIVAGVLGQTAGQLVNGNFLWWSPLVSLVSLLPLAYFMNGFLVYRGMKKPYFTWKSYQELVRYMKRHVVLLAWMLIAMAYSTVLIVMFVLTLPLINPAVVIAVGMMLPAVPAVFLGMYVDRLIIRHSATLFQNM